MLLLSRAAATATPTSAFVDTAARRGSTARTPIDPHLPPDHPLEPGSAAGQRAMPSAAERIAASEAAVDFVKPPVTPEQGAKPNFIAAARRAAQAAAAAPPERQARGESAAIDAAQSQKPSRLRKLIVAGAAVLIAGVFLHVALRMFQDRAPPSNSPDVPLAAPSQGTAPPAVLPESDSSKTAPRSGPLILPVPGTQSPTAPVTTPSTPSAYAWCIVQSGPGSRRRARRMHRPPYCNANRRCRTPRTSPAHCRVASRHRTRHSRRRASRWNRLRQRQRRQW